MNRYLRFYVAVWTGLELFLKMPCLQDLPRGRFLGSPQGSPFNIGLTFEGISYTNHQQ